jgi:hypothetical protein
VGKECTFLADGVGDQGTEAAVAGGSIFPKGNPCALERRKGDLGPGQGVLVSCPFGGKREGLPRGILFHVGDYGSHVLGEERVRFNFSVSYQDALAIFEECRNYLPRLSTTRGREACKKEDPEQREEEAEQGGG